MSVPRVGTESAARERQGSINQVEVSVVIPTFNRAATIERAVRSVLAQTWRHFELIIVDDGSYDDSITRVRNVADDRVRILCHDQNRGAAAARNTGIGAARGEYIAFLDSDDEWLPQKLALQVTELAAVPVDTAVSCTAFYLHLLDHGEVREIRPEQENDWFQRLCLGCDLSPGTTLLARRSVFDRVGMFDETLPRFEDWDWLLRYASLGKIQLLDNPLAHIYNRRGRQGRQLELSARRFLEKHEGELLSLDPRSRRQALANVWLQVTGTYAFEGSYWSALRTACHAAHIRPFHTLERLARNSIRYFPVS